MVTTATRVNPKFRKEVEKASRDKVTGEVVHRFRTLFAPDLVAKIRSGNTKRVGVSAYMGMGKKAAKKGAKKKA